VSLALNLRSIFYFIGLAVHVYPVEHWWTRLYGGDKAFTLPAPVVLGVFEEVAGEGVAGGFFKFEIFFDRDVVIGWVCDIKLEVGVL